MAGVTSDFLIFGGGVIGVNSPLQAKRRFPDADVVLVEKESHCGKHPSAGNSGVLHTGFYYSADTLKAHLTEVRLNREARPDKRSFQVEFGLYKKLASDYQTQVTFEVAIQDLADRLEFMNFIDSDFHSSQLSRRTALSERCALGL